MAATTSRRSNSSGVQSHRVRRQGGPYTSTEAKRRSGQKYYPNSSQARTNRKETGKASARTRAKSGTQWRHGRKSKAEVKSGR